ncbi:MAG: NAD(P)H-hydrate epimerase [Phycisphaerae bacterium]|nr:NAD(P)H-hydrate epimerase [Phycisphaerae bacterium]
MTKEIKNELVLSRQQVRACDQVAIEQYGIPGVVLMENAGAGAARHILSLLKNPTIARVCIFAGVGNNAGDGFVVARHLVNAGVKVKILTAGTPERFKGDALINLKIIEKMNLPIQFVETLTTDELISTVKKECNAANLLVDAMLGTGTVGPPRGTIRTMIDALTDVKKTIIALDIPSGLDCDTGKPLERAVIADQTITFAAMKKGFYKDSARQYLGQVHVVSIGIQTDLLIRD